MESYEPVSLVEKAKISEGHFDVTEFKRLLSTLDNQQFDQFCMRILSPGKLSGSAGEQDYATEENNIKDPVANWDAKGIEIDESYKQPVSNG